MNFERGTIRNFDGRTLAGEIEGIGGNPVAFHARDCRKLEIRRGKVALAGKPTHDERRAPRPGTGVVFVRTDDGSAAWRWSWADAYDALQDERIEARVAAEDELRGALQAEI